MRDGMKNERNNVLGTISYFGVRTLRRHIFKTNQEHLGVKSSKEEEKNKESVQRGFRGP